MCVCVFVCVCVCVGVSVYACVLYVHACVCVRAHACVCACMCVRACVCVYARASVCKPLVYVLCSFIRLVLSHLVPESHTHTHTHTHGGQVTTVSHRPELRSCPRQFQTDPQTGLDLFAGGIGTSSRISHSLWVLGLAALIVLPVQWELCALTVNVRVNNLVAL